MGPLDYFDAALSQTLVEQSIYDALHDKLACFKHLDDVKKIKEKNDKLFKITITIEEVK